MRVNKIRLLLLVSIGVSIVAAFGGTGAVRELSALELSAIRGGGVVGQLCYEDECWCACSVNECDEIFICVPVYNSETFEFEGYAESLDGVTTDETCLFTDKGNWQCEWDREGDLVFTCLYDLWYTDDTCSGTADEEDETMGSFPCTTIR